MSELALNAVVISICLIVVIFVIGLFLAKNGTLRLLVSRARDNSLQPINSMVAEPKLRTKMVLANHFADVPFDVAFRQNGLSEVIVRNSIEPVDAMFRTLLPAVPNGVRIIESITKKDNGIVFGLSDAGKQLLQTGQAEIMKTADGTRWLPQIRSVKDKSIIELFKAPTVSRLSNLAKTLPQLANVAVAAANIISNFDMVSKLELLDKKVDSIIAGRHLDKKAELESCYRLVSEIKLICDKGDWEPKLYDIHAKLTKLRCDWKNEAAYKLTNINNPYEKGFAGFVKNHRYLPRFLMREGKQDRTIQGSIDEIRELLFLNDFAVLFDFALCSAIDHPFSLEEEIRTIDLVTEEIRKKATFLSDRSKDCGIEKHLAYLDHCKKKYRCLSEDRKSGVLLETDPDRLQIEGQGG